MNGRLSLHVRYSRHGSLFFFLFFFALTARWFVFKDMLNLVWNIVTPFINLFIYIFFLLPVNCRFPVWSSIDQYRSIDCSHTRPLSLQHFPYFLLGFLPLGASWIRRREKEAWAWHCPRWRHHLRIGKRTDETSGGKSIGRTTWRAHLRL
jgi:hypothetical protein